MVLQKRLGYYGRLATTGPQLLWALLQYTEPNKGARLPYALQVARDLAALWDTSPSAQLELPDPRTAPATWLDVMRHSPALWRRLASELFFEGSVLDAADASASPPPPPP